MVATATALAGRNREGTQWEAERVRERWRELMVLLRLKLRLDEAAGAGKTEGVDARDDGKVLPETRSLRQRQRCPRLRALLALLPRARLVERT